MRNAIRFVVFVAALLVAIISSSGVLLEAGVKLKGKFVVDTAKIPERVELASTPLEKPTNWLGVTSPTLSSEEVFFHVEELKLVVEIGRHKPGWKGNVASSSSPRKGGASGGAGSGGATAATGNGNGAPTGPTGGTPTGGLDSGTPSQDSGTPSQDSGTPKQDSARPEYDSNGNKIDYGPSDKAGQGTDPNTPPGADQKGPDQTATAMSVVPLATRELSDLPNSNELEPGFQVLGPFTVPGIVGIYMDGIGNTKPIAFVRVKEIPPKPEEVAKGDTKIKLLLELLAPVGKKKK